MTRDVLLRKWSELAPGECGKAELNGPRRLAIPGPEGKELRYIRRAELFGVDDRAILLSALIEAVRARGWACTLTAGYDSASAYVIYNKGTEYQFCAMPELCDALLAAYTQAIEVAPIAALSAGKE